MLIKNIVALSHFIGISYLVCT